MRGIDKFKERFAGHDSEYVLIGGGACDLLFGEAGQDFRATKDLDLVLLVEALTPEFGRVFWDFVKEGGYENRQKSSGKPQFYRFSKPEDPAFPAMLELFARTDVDLRDAESGLMPIHIDDEVSSLSAILLDEDYYRLLVENRASAGGVAVLSVEGLIPFKAKAWLDLSARRAGGQAVDEKSVKKHRNDVCRLATLLAGGERPAMSEGVRADMRRFLEAYESDPVDPKALKIKGVGRSRSSRCSRASTCDSRAAQSCYRETSSDLYRSDILNGVAVVDARIGADAAVIRALAEAGLSHRVRTAKIKDPRIRQIAILMYLHAQLVPEGSGKKSTSSNLAGLEEKLLEMSNLAPANDAIQSAMAFLAKLIDGWFR